MRDIKVAFWTLQNLLDTTASEIAADLEATPNEGWTPDVRDAKLDARIGVIASMCDGTGPELPGIRESEDEALTDRLVNGLNAHLGRSDDTDALDEAEDLRGIGCGLIHSKDVFDPAGDATGHLVHLRYATGVNGWSHQVFDQMIVSRGLRLGCQALRMTEQDVSVHMPRSMWTNPRLPTDTGRHRLRPKAFDRANNTGVGDHFPVLGVVRAA